MTTGVDEVEKGGGDRKEESLKKSFVGIHQNAIVPIRPLTSTSGGKFHVCKNILPALLLLRLFFFFNFPLFFPFLSSWSSNLCSSRSCMCVVF